MGKVDDVAQRIAESVPPNYRPLRFVPRAAVREFLFGLLERPDGSEGFVTVLDFHTSYSAASLGHNHPELVAIEMERLLKNKPALIARGAVMSEEFSEFAKLLTGLCGMDKMIPKNDGTGAFDVAVKAARRWAHLQKGELECSIENSGRLCDGESGCRAEIVVCADNFHGRSGLATQASSDPLTREGFGPFGPRRAFIKVPFGDPGALDRAITKNTVAVIVEPIQAEAGIVFPPFGYLQEVRRMCTRSNALFIVDEVQTGLGRTGELFAWQYEEREAEPDGIMLGKALGGGVEIVSAFVSSNEILGTLTEGTEGNTFAGSPRVSAVAKRALELLADPALLRRVRVLGEKFIAELKGLQSPLIKEVRGRGLLAAIELAPDAGEARWFYEELLKEGLLCIKRHDNILGFSPPLTISEHNLLVCAVDKVRRVFSAKGEPASDWGKA